MYRVNFVKNGEIRTTVFATEYWAEWYKALLVAKHNFNTEEIEITKINM